MVLSIKLKLGKSGEEENHIRQQKMERLLKMEFKNHRDVLKEMVAMEFDSLGINSDSVFNNQEEMKEWITRKRHQLLKIDEEQNKKRKKGDSIPPNQMEEDDSTRLQPTSATMPSELLHAIITKHRGEDVVLVMEKTLTATDASSGHGRLSIPESRVKVEKFLSDAERRQASYSEIPVDALVLVMGAQKPELWSFNFKKWMMNKTGIYVLIRNWAKLVVDKNLLEGDTVQIWSFRSLQNGGGKKLCFAINVLQG
ncbi:putative B3 domain-containing protein At2g27410 [Macadamia integrifolia]|uniref:putative B3 domain-containing protein At2g27410 n=1 Tax=Macadamia integrifolia TaxID=60698 RepID=UPI001C52870C|nr:putative B3 domain-containing protein At2g27410 [Macadamia integrifolia]